VMPDVETALAAGPEPIGATLDRLLGNHPQRDLILKAAEAARGAPRLDDTEGLVCLRCRDAGWLRRNAMPGEPGFGELVECSCPAGQQAKQKRQERIWSATLVPPKMAKYSLETLAKRPGKADLVAELRRWQQSRSDLLLWGTKGTCKTGGAISLLLEHVAAGGQGLYIVLPTFLDRLNATYHRQDDEPGLLEVLATVIEAELLVLDDIGVNRRALSESAKDKLFTVVNERDLHERQTIFTTNLTPKAFASHVGELTADRIRGRLGLSNRWMVECSGTSQRGLDL